MNSPELKAFIKEHHSLFWYTPNDEKENISHELIIETILNYGDIEAIKKMFAIMGKDNVSRVFNDITGRKIMNYYPEIYNLFSLYFKKYANRFNQDFD